MSYRAVRNLGVSVGLFLTILVWGALAYLVGPSIEGYLFPIINNAPRGNVLEAADGHTCWDTSMEKLRPGVPAYALYTTMIHDQPVSIFVYLAKNGTPLTQPAFQNHPPGEKWITRYCTDLPEQLRSRPRRIDGMIYYSVAYRPSWWLVPQALPSLELPAAD